MALMKNVFLVVCIACIYAICAHSATPNLTPAPSIDCSNLILNMADCLSYVTNGSTVSMPEGTCCSGLKTVLKADAECLCEAFKSSAQLGVVLNVTKAVTLPSACHVSAPSVSNCQLSTATGAAPAPATVLSPASTPISTAAAPGTTVESANEQAPALAPAIAGSAFLSISVASIVVGLVLASSFSFF